MWSADMQSVHLLLAWTAIFFGATLLCTSPTLSAYPDFNILLTIAPEWVWGVFWLLHGAASLFALLCGRARHGIFCLDAILGCVLWTATTTSIFISGAHITPFVGPSITASVASFWVLVRYKKITKGRE